MSHSYASSTTATTASTAQPLSDILPWGSPLAIDTSGAFVTRASSSSSCPSLDDDRRSILRTRRRARTLLVTDGISADGRFLLHSLALQFLSSRAIRGSPPSSDDRRTKRAEEGSVLWIGGGPLAESQICGGLRKGMAVRLGGIGSGGGDERSLEREERDETTMGKLHVIAVPLELADAAMLGCSDDDDGESGEGKGEAFDSNDNDDDEDDATAEKFSHERYLKGLHRRIVHWLYHRELLSVEAASATTAAKSTRRHPGQQQQQNQQGDMDTTTNNTATRNIQSHPLSSSYMGPNLVIVDNLSVFSSLFGDVLTHAFLTNVRAALKRHAERTSGEVSWSVFVDDVGFDSRKQDDNHLNNMSTATPATITTITTTNLLAVRCTSPDDGGMYHLDDGDDDDLDTPSESGRVVNTPSVKRERLRSEHARLLRPWWGMGSGCGGGGNALIGRISDEIAGTTSHSSESGTNVPMGGTIASPHSTICHLEERSHRLSLFPSAEIGGVGGPFHAPSSSQWHSTSTSTSLLHKIGIYEYSDGIVDVSPLESGYARDILGRISFTSVWGGRGWWGRGDTYGGSGGGGIGNGTGIGGKEKQNQDGIGAFGEAYASICVNYRCEDGGVRVLRLRSR